MSEKIREALMDETIASYPDFCEAVRDALDQLAAKDAEIARLRLTLKEAREMVAHWGAYASEYFQDKHDLPGDLGELDAVLSENPHA